MNSGSAITERVDQSLARHFRRSTRVKIVPVIDPEEISAARIDGVLDGRFEFNGQTHRLDDPASEGSTIDWLSNPDDDIEWHILLHKFYYAVGLAQRWRDSGDLPSLVRWRALIDSWIDVVPPGFIAADVTGRRVQNWIYSLYIVLGSDVATVTRILDSSFLERVNGSIALQLDYLCDNLTPKRNHRTLELLAIFLGGVMFPEHRRSEYWRSFALQQTVENAATDLLADGVHCEQSTDYHHLALRNWLQVRTLAADNQIPVPPALDAALLKGLEFSLHVHNPAGVVPSFSDGDVRSYLALLQQGADLFDRPDMRFVASAGRTGIAPADRFASFDASGYHIVRSDWAAAPHFDRAQHLVFDCGPLGEGNHGHFDALSFELYAFGQALVIDPGRFTYSESIDPADGCNWRVRFRSTRAHNTVCVDDQSQTRYEPKAAKAGTRHRPGTLRHRIAGPEPRTRLIERASGPSVDLLHGRCESHAYEVVHDRAIAFIGRRYWIVDDGLRSAQVHHYRLRFQLAPSLLGADTRIDFGRSDCAGTAVTRWDASRPPHTESVRLRAPGLDILQWLSPGHRVRLSPSWVSLRYGRKVAAPAMDASTRAAEARFVSILVPQDVGGPATGDTPIGMIVESVRASDGRDAQVVRIDLDNGQHDHWFFDSEGTGGEWHLGSRRFNGRWLYWREATDGVLLCAQSHPGATLSGPGSGRLSTAADR